MVDDRRRRLLDLARLFLRLGATAFGGPAAHIALFEEEVVRRRGWLTREALLDYLGAANLIPGPNSTEVALYIGLARAGWLGLLTAGIAFIAPAALIVGVAAWVYSRYGTLPAITAPLYGIKPVVIAIVAQALWRLARAGLRTFRSAAVGVGAVVALVFGVHEVVVLIAAGVALAAWSGWQRRGVLASVMAAGFTSAREYVADAALAIGTSVVAEPFSLGRLFAVFLKAGSLVFGSGYVLLAFLRTDLVDRLGWLTERQLFDAAAIGLVTPGPVFTTATFIGYLLGGASGAVVASVGIFLPGFVLVALSGPLIPRIRRSAIAGAVLDGVNVASLALMALVSIQLGRAALIDSLSTSIAIISVVLLARSRLNTAWLIVGGGLVGWIAMRA